MIFTNVNINTKITFTLSEDDVKQIVANYIMSHYGHKNITKENVELNVGSRCVGYYNDEHYEYYFKECVVRLEE